MQSIITRNVDSMITLFGIFFTLSLLYLYFHVIILLIVFILLNVFRFCHRYSPRCVFVPVSHRAHLAHSVALRFARHLRHIESNNNVKSGKSVSMYTFFGVARTSERTSASRRAFGALFGYRPFFACPGVPKKRFSYHYNS